MSFRDRRRIDRDGGLHQRPALIQARMTSPGFARPITVGRTRSDTPVIVAAWCLLTIGLFAARWSPRVASGPADTDSLMRMAEIRDFLAGQRWTDLTQLRMNA